MWNVLSGPSLRYTQLFLSTPKDRGYPSQDSSMLDVWDNDQRFVSFLATEENNPHRDSGLIIC